MQRVGKGLYMSEERLLKKVQRNEFGTDKDFFQQIWSLFKRKTKAEETSEPKNDSV